MKQAGKNAKILTTLVLLVLAFFCSFSITYSYFTATANLPGTLSFSDLDVRFVVTDYVDGKLTELPQGVYTQDNLYTITLYPLEEAIPRGGEIKLSYSNLPGAEEIQNLQIKLMSGSCDAFVRFWIDVYTKSGETLGTKNYGEFFSFTSVDSQYIAQGGIGNNINSELSNSCYFIKDYMGPTADVSIMNLGKSLTISETLPDEVLGSQLQITISLQAVQAVNGLYSTEAGFNDERGYCANWSQSND